MRKDPGAPLGPPGRPSPSKSPAPCERGVAIGDLLGKCLLTDRFGRGGSCTVFRALHQALNVPVAVKVLQLDAGAAHDRALEQMRFEAHLLAQLHHPHIVRVFDFDDSPALPYLVLDSVEGPSLSDLIQQSGRLSLDRACEIVGQVASALDAVWQLGAVHRDVKPGNILLSRAGAAVLADFGQAVLVEAQELSSFDESRPASDGLSGTAAYLAPEQFLAPATVDHRADLYALGATFYQMVTGQLPFAGRSRMEVMLKHSQETPPPPHLVVPGLGAQVSEVILTLMSKKPEDRYQDVDELLDALAALAAEPAAAEAFSEPPAAETMETPVNAERPRGSFWQALLPRFGPGPAPRPRRSPNDEWLHFVKGTLIPSASRKREE
jgi:eukaryotic-like serine/threonine-protein kinase